MIKQLFGIAIGVYALLAQAAILELNIQNATYKTLKNNLKADESITKIDCAGTLKTSKCLITYVNNKTKKSRSVELGPKNSLDLLTVAQQKNINTSINNGNFKFTLNSVVLVKENIIKVDTLLLEVKTEEKKPEIKVEPPKEVKKEEEVKVEAKTDLNTEETEESKDEPNVEKRILVPVGHVLKQGILGHPNIDGLMTIDHTPGGERNWFKYLETTPSPTFEAEFEYSTPVDFNAVKSISIIFNFMGYPGKDQLWNFFLKNKKGEFVKVADNSSVEVWQWSKKKFKIENPNDFITADGKLIVKYSNDFGVGDAAKGNSYLDYLALEVKINR